MSLPESREDWIVRETRKRPPAERAAFLDGACAGDLTLRERLERLLAAPEQPETLLATQAEATRPTMKVAFADEPADEAVGQSIGRYKVLEKIGEGGCGVVYVAEQTEPVRRRVALKVIKLGMDTKQVVARFEAERQALALMDHPNIAKVLDAGATDAGRPYFVMELVRGIRITDYCDQANLTTKERLELFIQVCQAIQHAHQKGIIHRDIKPSNILVTLHDGVPVPKVIDFGIAKATEGRLTDATVYTQLHQFIGTPAYMSPEQAEMSGLDIDTRSDIYSLGVLLYELLAGRTPFDANELMSKGIDVMRKTIREQEPPRPSTRLATLKGEELTTTAKRRSAEVAKLLHQLKGDLDWIVMKCLEKDRTRRYETANGLAADLKRHLNNEPVVARPPSAGYRFQKACRRNRGVFAAVAGVGLALVSGMVVSTWQAVRAKRAEAQALTEKANALVEKGNAQAALHFIQDDVLSQASPGYQPDRELTVRALLERIVSRLDQASERPPLVEASIRQTLGSVYTELGDYPKAAQQYERAIQLQREHLGDSHTDTLRSLYGLVMARWWNGEIAQAEPLTRQGLETSRKVLGEKNPLTLQFMQARAFVLMILGDLPWTEVESLFLHSLALHNEVLGPGDLGTLKTAQGLSHGYTMNWQGAKAEPFAVDALDRAQHALGENHPQTGVLMITLAWVYEQLNQLEKAETLARRSLELRRRILGPRNPRTLSCVFILAGIYVQQGQFEKAESLTEEALKQIRELPAFRDLYLPLQLSELGWAYFEQGQFARAETLCELGLSAMRGKSDVNPVALPRVITQLAVVRLQQGKNSEAEALLRESLRLVEQHWPDGPYRFYVMSLLGESLAGQQKYAEAEPLLEQGCEGLLRLRASLPPFLNPARRVTESFERLAHCYDAGGKPTKAAEARSRLSEFQEARKAGQGQVQPP
jgi:eukaryotic-like serine/threonine-protein kinase